jgi:hypothetical protein
MAISTALDALHVQQDASIRGDNLNDSEPARQRGGYHMRARLMHLLAHMS